jgi:hypothetical protein
MSTERRESYVVVVVQEKTSLSRRLAGVSVVGTAAPEKMRGRGMRKA